MNELAKLITEDSTQPQRAVCNYLLEIHRSVKDFEFDLLDRGEMKFDDPIDFFGRVILEGAEMALDILENMKRDEPEEYANA